jgi:hypothetical protein
MDIGVTLPVFPEDDERCIRIMSGIEERARKYPGKPWEIKTAQCNLCGKCCMTVPEGWKYGKDPKTGWCKHLVYNEGWDNGGTKLGYLCDFGAARPMSCSVGDEAGKDYCSVEWDFLK